MKTPAHATIRWSPSAHLRARSPPHGPPRLPPQPVASSQRAATAPNGWPPRTHLTASCRSPARHVPSEPHTWQHSSGSATHTPPRRDPAALRIPRVGPGPAWQRARAKLRGWRAAAKSAIRRVVSEVVDKVKKRGVAGYKRAAVVLP